MTSMGVRMSDDRGEGERAEKARSRRFWTILIVLMLAGGVIGGLQSAVTGGDLSRDLPAVWAVVLAAIYLVAVGAGSWYFFRSIDEVEMYENLLAYTVGAYFYATVYPLWYFLWKGGLVIEPVHEGLFLATMFVIGAFYIGKKLRP